MSTPWWPMTKTINISITTLFLLLLFFFFFENDQVTFRCLLQHNVSCGRGQNHQAYKQGITWYFNLIVCALSNIGQWKRVAICATVYFYVKWFSWRILEYAFPLFHLPSIPFMQDNRPHSILRYSFCKIKGSCLSITVLYFYFHRRCCSIFCIGDIITLWYHPIHRWESQERRPPKTSS